MYSYIKGTIEEINLDNGRISESDSFQKGVEKASFYAGFYSCLVNCGISTQDAFELMLNENTCKNNQKLQRIVNSGSIDVARIQDDKSL